VCPLYGAPEGFLGRCGRPFRNYVAKFPRKTHLQERSLKRCRFRPSRDQIAAFLASLGEK